MSEPLAVALGPAQRRRALERIREETFDVLVIGGGVTGSGAALDAASRGLSVCQVEAEDLAAGTSSRSSKLIHGGLRYLEQLDFALVREALGERTLLLDRLCPHLAQPVPFLLPLRHRVWERAYLGAGVLLYDTLGGRRGLPRHRHLSRRRALATWPSLRPDRLAGAIQYWDGQVDDARHTLFVARTAASLGAAFANRVQVTGMLSEGGRVVGARAVDRETGAELAIRAWATISATGVWTGRSSPASGLSVQASKGVHLVVPRHRLRGETGLIARTEKSVLFVIPWGAEHWIIGTTDTAWDLPVDQPAPTRTDIRYLLDHVNAEMADQLRPDDIVGVYTGLRPLLAGEQGATTKLSREHATATPVPGLVEIAGGKYTTYRVMARDAVDAAVASSGLGAGPSRTEMIPLVGASGFDDRWSRRAELGARYGLPTGTVERLLRRYGALIDEVMEPAAHEPALGLPLAGSGGYLGAEILYAASHEGALHLTDVLERRTRIAIENADRGAAASGEAARIVGRFLGWDREEQAAEREGFEARLVAQQRAESMADDAGAVMALTAEGERGHPAA